MPEASTLPLVSVIVTTYNRAHLLPRALDSVLQQTYSNLELIAVDDGSTDDTAEVLATFQATCPFPFKIVHFEENRGVNVARNAGFRAVSGPLSTFVDSDDVLLPQAVETLVSRLEALGSDYGMVFANCKDSVGQLTGYGLTHDQEVTYQDAICGRFTGEFAGLWRTTILEGLTLDESLRAAHEAFVWHQVYRRCKVYYIHTAVKTYHTNATDSISVLSFDRERNKGDASAQLLYLEEFEEDIKKFCPKCLANYYRNLALYQVLAGERVDAAVSVLRTVKYWPKPAHLALLALPLTPLTILKFLLHRRTLARGRRVETVYRSQESAKGASR